MPRNINGVYALPSGNPVVPGTLIESTWANPTMSDIGNELTQSLPRNGAAPMTGPLMLFRDGALPKEAVTFQQLTASVAGQNSYLPAGAIQAFAMAAIPTGWLEANGSAVSRTTYANLFATIGTTYGVGNGTTTFNLPDLRGEFIRGLDNGRSVDPGRTLGSNQTAANNPHSHALTDPGHIHASPPHTHGVTDPGHDHNLPFTNIAGTGVGELYNGAGGPLSAVNSNVTGVSVNSATVSINSSTTGITSAQEGTEARPRNVAMVYCIKAFGALQTDGLGTMAFQNKEAVQITGGTGEFTTLACATAPVSPNDVVRLGDIGGTMTDIDSSDIQILLVDKTNPNIPILRPQVNVPFGMVKLDANAKVPNALIDPTGYNYQGTWNASGGTLPGGTQLDGSMYYVDVAGTLNLYHSNGVQSSTLCPIGTRIVYVTDSPTLPVPGWYYEPPPVLTGVTASQIAFAPTGTVAATDVQAAIDEVAAEKAPLVHTHVAANITNLSAANTPFTPAGTIAATDVQAAIVEVVAETVPRTGTTGAAIVPTGNTAQRPGSPVEGYFRRNSQLAQWEGHDGANWVGINSVLAGTIIDFAGTSPPPGYLACPIAQTNISRTTYAELFAAIGTTWGVGDGSTTFGMPWFPAGYASVQENANVGTSTTGQIPAHNHAIITVGAPGSGATTGMVLTGTGSAQGTITTYITGAGSGTANVAAGVCVLKCVKY